MARPRKSKRLTLLGRSETTVPSAPTATILETFPNPRNVPIGFVSNRRTSPRSVQSLARLISREITIDYQPAKRCLETKSLKFYLASYRNERAFNEAVTNHILDDLVRACAPRQMIVTAEFASRGGISLTITAAHPDEIEPRADDEARRRLAEWRARFRHRPRHLPGGGF